MCLQEGASVWEPGPRRPLSQAAGPSMRQGRPFPELRVRAGAASAHTPCGPSCEKETSQLMPTVQTRWSPLGTEISKRRSSWQADRPHGANEQVTGPDHSHHHPPPAAGACLQPRTTQRPLLQLTARHPALAPEGSRQPCQASISLLEKSRALQSYAGA